MIDGERPVSLLEREVTHRQREKEWERERNKSQKFICFLIKGLFFCQKWFRDLLGKNSENKILNFKVILRTLSAEAM